jgi:hypothetical protein
MIPASCHTWELCLPLKQGHEASDWSKAQRIQDEHFPITMSHLLCGPGSVCKPMSSIERSFPGQENEKNPDELKGYRLGWVTGLTVTRHVDLCTQWHTLWAPVITHIQVFAKVLLSYTQKGHWVGGWHSRGCHSITRTDIWRRRREVTVNSLQPHFWKILHFDLIPGLQIPIHFTQRESCHLMGSALDAHMKSLPALSTSGL